MSSPMEADVVCLSDDSADFSTSKQTPHKKYTYQEKMKQVVVDTQEEPAPKPKSHSKSKPCLSLDLKLSNNNHSDQPDFKLKPNSGSSSSNQRPSSMLTKLMKKPATPMYSCRYCKHKFHSCQALGGHQNAHKRERNWEKQMKYMQDAFKNPFSANQSKPYLSLAPTFPFSRSSFGTPPLGSINNLMHPMFRNFKPPAYHATWCQQLDAGLSPYGSSSIRWSTNPFLYPPPRFGTRPPTMEDFRAWLDCSIASAMNYVHGSSSTPYSSLSNSTSAANMAVIGGGGAAAAAAAADLEGGVRLETHQNENEPEQEELDLTLKL